MINHITDKLIALTSNNTVRWQYYKTITKIPAYSIYKDFYTIIVYPESKIIEIYDGGKIINVLYYEDVFLSEVILNQVSENENIIKILDIFGENNVTKS